MSEAELRESIDRLEQERNDALAQYDTVSAMLERSNNQAHVIYNISKAIASTHRLEKMVTQIIAIIKKAVTIDRSTLYLLDEERKRLALCWSDGLGVNAPVSIAVGEGLPGRIVEIGEHSHVHDLALFYETFNDFIHVPGEEKRDGSHISIALKSHGVTIGSLGIDTPEKYGLSVEDMDFMALISPLLSAGIEKAMLFSKNELLSRTDGLTGLFNHRVFEEKILQELNRRSRTRKPLGLIMLDVDHFKKFNDSFGHQEGDAVLRELAGIVNENCRNATIDTCFRYGGEEFAVLLPEEDLQSALFVAERMRGAVEEHPFSVKRNHPDARVTISLGVAVAGEDEDIAAEVFLKKADDALYAAKREGRNRVCNR